MKHIFTIIFMITLLNAEVTLQVLGSGGPELTDRASASYLIKKDNKAKILIDFGGGAALRFGQSKANIEDLNAVLITHLHIDHVVDLPALMKAGYFSSRSETLPLVGPTGSRSFPGFKEYINLQFGKHGAYRYMHDILSDSSDSFKIEATEVEDKQSFNFKGIKVEALAVNHGMVPAIAYSIEIEGKKIVFSGDTTAQSDNLIALSKNADLLIAHHAIPQNGWHGARQLHMTPERIGEVAAKANVKKLLLSHRMLRTLGYEKESESMIRKHYKGVILWAEDLEQITIK